MKMARSGSGTWSATTAKRSPSCSSGNSRGVSHGVGWLLDRVRRQS
jgi:hypothetical protein